MNEWMDDNDDVVDDMLYGLSLLIFFDFRLASVTRGHPYKVLKHHCSCTTTRSTFFAERVVNIWNSLPCDTVDFSSLSAFKRTIERTDFSRFLCFPEFL